MAFPICSRLVLIVLGVFVMFGAAPQVFADEGVDDIDETSLTVQERVKEFSKDFDKASEQHFFTLYSSYNLIQVVEEVRTQVSGAIEKCGVANPDMKDALQSRYDEWDGALTPIIEDANANVDNMIIAQEYAKPRDIKKLLKFIDKKRVSRADDVKKFPVTSPEACEYLRNKMDDTQENLTTLLKSTLVSLPNAMIHSGNVDDSDDANVSDDSVDVDNGDEGE